MFRKITVIVLGLCALALGVSEGTYRFSQNFLAAAVNCAASTTLVNGVGFTSATIDVSRLPENGLVTVTFTRAAGSASTVDFEFQVSYDAGVSWSTVYYIVIRVATNSTAVTNAVRYTVPVYFSGVSHIRLYRIVNNDGANNLTVCNARVSF